MKTWITEGKISKENMYRQICINEKGDKYTGCYAWATISKKIHDGEVDIDFVVKPIERQPNLVDPFIFL